MATTERSEWAAIIADLREYFQEVGTPTEDDMQVAQVAGDALDKADKLLAAWFQREEIIRIIFTEEDVKGMAEDLEIDEEVALERAWEWGKHIADTATGLCSEQLESCIKINTP